MNASTEQVESQCGPEDPYSITEDILLQRSSTVNKGRYIKQFYCAAISSLGSLCFGLVLGWASPAFRVYTTDGELGIEHYARIADKAPLGCCLGALIISLLTQRQGPRKIGLFLSPILLITWLICMSIKKSMVQYFGIVFSTFLSIGFKITGDVLLTDSVDVGNLYLFLVIVETSVQLGILLSYTLILMTERIQYLFSIVFTLLLSLHFIMLFFTKESPRFLYLMAPEKAMRAIKFYRGPTNIHTLMRQLRKDKETTNVDLPVKYMLFKPVIYKAVTRILIFYFFQVFSGYYAFVFYGLVLFNKNSYLDEGNVSRVGKIWDSFFRGILYYSANLAADIFHYKLYYGVRKPLLFSSLCVTFVLYAISGYFYLIENQIWFTKMVMWLKITLEVCFVLSYELGLGILPNVIMIDYLPFQIYPYVKTFTIFFKWLMIFVLVHFILEMEENAKSSGCFLILAIVSTFGILCISFLTIESKDKTLLQLQIKLGGNPVGSRNTSHIRYKKIVIGS